MKRAGFARGSFVRKQVTITRFQNAWLKEKAGATDESEAHWVRWALDRAIRLEQVSAQMDASELGIK
jgi:hypothetical protein